MKKKIIIIGALVVVAGAVAFFLLRGGDGLQVNGAETSKGSIEEYVEETGTVMARNNIQVYSPASGKVTEVLVDVGDTVVEGDVLATLDGETLSLQLAQLDAQRSAAVAQLNEAKKAGNANAIRSLQLDIEQMEGTIQQEEEKFLDTRTLYEAGAISQDQLRASERSIENQMTNLAKMKLQLNQLNSPVSGNLIAQYEAQIRQIDLQKQEISSSGDDYTIVAGTTGTVLQKTVQEGSFLQPGMSLMELGDTDNLYIQSDILVSEISDIEVGLAVKLLNEDLGIEATGKVQKIHPNAFSKISDLGVEQKRITVEIQMDTIPDLLKPGYDLQVRIITESSGDTLIIPENAVFTMNHKDYVFVDAVGIAELREIQTGIQSGRVFEVLSGLVEGEVVIMSPDGELEEGSKIEVIVE
ncbi:efflux RND transporter periplasmic adaptor subunit [Gudongella sp. DL1XJH-153]|uniref:efflux RND transporter periplasmic adaptor subunit n=1 Tax=Gudongella sp. DL1XJH-153 TaxID=3409804 RepID=UPI003BB735E7